MFVAWGALHGLYLVIAHLWSAAGLKLSRVVGKTLAPYAGWALTLFAVVIAWVFFRATTLTGAMAMFRGMAGMNGVNPAHLSAFLADPRLWGVGSPLLLALLAIAAPNSMWLVARAERMFTEQRRLGIIAAGLATGFAVLIALVFIGAQNEFLYFQF